MPWLGGADAVMYVLIGVVFLGGALAMLVYSVWVFYRSVSPSPEGSSFADNVVTLINDLLLVMIIMEVLRTIGSYIEERGASLRPVSVYRRDLRHPPHSRHRRGDEHPRRQAHPQMSSTAASWTFASMRA